MLRKVKFFEKCSKNSSKNCSNLLLTHSTSCVEELLSSVPMPNSFSNYRLQAFEIAHQTVIAADKAASRKLSNRPPEFSYICILRVLKKNSPSFFPSQAIAPRQPSDNCRFFRTFDPFPTLQVRQATEVLHGHAHPTPVASSMTSDSVFLLGPRASNHPANADGLAFFFHFELMPFVQFAPALAKSSSDDTM